MADTSKYRKSVVNGAKYDYMILGEYGDPLGSIELWNKYEHGDTKLDAMILAANAGAEAARLREDNAALHMALKALEREAGDYVHNTHDWNNAPPEGLMAALSGAYAALAKHTAAGNG